MQPLAPASSTTLADSSGGWLYVNATPTVVDNTTATGSAQMTGAIDGSKYVQLQHINGSADNGLRSSMLFDDAACTTVSVLRPGTYKITVAATAYLNSGSPQIPPYQWLGLLTDSSDQYGDGESVALSMGSTMHDYTVSIKIDSSHPRLGQPFRLKTTFSANSSTEFGESVYTYSPLDNFRVEFISEDYTNWLAGFTFAGGADTTPSGDPDGDGLSNREEYAYGLNPISGSSVSPIPVVVNKSTGKLTYTRRKQSLSGASYELQTSTDLISWATGASSQVVVSTVGDIETVEVTMNNLPLTAEKFFARIKAITQL